MKTVICNKSVQNFTKGVSYQVKNYDYSVYAAKGDNGKYTVVNKSHFVRGS